MNKIKLFTLCLFLLAACSSSNVTNLQIFIIGRWERESLQEAGNSSAATIYDIEFLPFNILLVDISRPEETVHGLRFSYKFTTNNHIRIEGRIINEIQVLYDRQNSIVIETDHGLPPSGRYKRVFSRLDWLLVFVLILLAIVSFVQHHRKIDKTMKSRTFTTK